MHQQLIKKNRKKSMHKLAKLLPQKYRHHKTLELLKSTHLKFINSYDYEYNFSHLVLGYSSLTIMQVD